MRGEGPMLDSAHESEVLEVLGGRGDTGLRPGKQVWAGFGGGKCRQLLHES